MLGGTHVSIESIVIKSTFQDTSLATCHDRKYNYGGTLLLSGGTHMPGYKV